jgi:nucleoid DNA-binding protein
LPHGCGQEGPEKGRKGDPCGFWPFCVDKRAAHAGCNSGTGAGIKPKAVKIAKFRAGKDLKDTVQ